MKYKQILLDNRAIDYINLCLREGSTLAQYILTSVNLMNGIVKTVMPIQVDLERAHDFTSGGKIPTPHEPQWEHFEGAMTVPIRNTDFYVISAFETFLKRSNRHVCILENALANSQDPHVSKLRSRIYTAGDEVYHILLSRDAEQSKITRALREAHSIPIFIGMMTSWPEEVAAVEDQRRTVSFELLQLMAKQTEALVVGAYDGEGYLIWYRPSP